MHMPQFKEFTYDAMLCMQECQCKFSLLGICKGMVDGLCQVLLSFMMKDLLGVPITIRLWYGCQTRLGFKFV